MSVLGRGMKALLGEIEWYRERDVSRRKEGLRICRGINTEYDCVMRSESGAIIYLLLGHVGRR